MDINILKEEQKIISLLIEKYEKVKKQENSYLDSGTPVCELFNDINGFKTIGTYNGKNAIMTQCTNDIGSVSEDKIRINKVISQSKFVYVEVLQRFYFLDKLEKERLIIVVKDSEEIFDYNAGDFISGRGCINIDDDDTFKLIKRYWLSSVYPTKELIELKKCKFKTIVTISE